MRRLFFTHTVVSVVLEGGFDCNCENIAGVTRINGTFTINDGMLSAVGISVQ
jgi:hypothetical protein